MSLILVLEACQIKDTSIFGELYCLYISTSFRQFQCQTSFGILCLYSRMLRASFQVSISQMKIYFFHLEVIACKYTYKLSTSLLISGRVAWRLIGFDCIDPRGRKSRYFWTGVDLGGLPSFASSENCYIRCPLRPMYKMLVLTPKLPQRFKIGQNGQKRNQADSPLLGHLFVVLISFLAQQHCRILSFSE